MIALARVSGKLFRPALVCALAAAVTAVVLLIVGSTTGGVVALAVATVCALPVAARAFATPRPGLVWQGSVAEPWRSERSPGEPTEIEAGRRRGAGDGPGGA